MRNITNINYSSWLKELYENEIIGHYKGLYYCNPTINVNTKTKEIKFEIIPYYLDETECDYEYFNEKGIEKNDIDTICKKLNDICVFDLTKENIDFIMENLLAMGFIKDEVTNDLSEKEIEKYKQYLMGLCDYDFSNYDEEEFFKYHWMPAYCEGFLVIDDVCIF